MIRIASVTLFTFFGLTWTKATADEPVAAWKDIGSWAVAFSGDGKWVAAGGKVPTTVKTIQDALKPTDGLLKVWDVGSRREVFHLLDPEKRVACLAFSPQESFVAVGYGRRDLQFSGPDTDRSPLIVWNVAEKKKMLTLARAYGYQSVAFSPNGKLLASASDIAGEKIILLTLWEMPSGKQQRQWKLKQDEMLVLSALTFSPDNKHLALGGGTGVPEIGRTTKGNLSVVDVESGEFINRFSDFADWVQSVAFSPDGKHLACGTSERDTTVRIYDWTEKKLVSSFKPHTFGVRSVAFGRNAKVLFTVGMDRVKEDKVGSAWKAWDVPSGRSLHSQKTEGTSVTMALSPDGSLLATGGPDGVQLWKVPKDLQNKK